MDDFTDGVWATTVINSNSPRMLDIPMAQGLIDFAAAGQMSIITPFCLAGAMAPIKVAGALTLQHAEALTGITLAQLTRAGAPISYGGFSSNVAWSPGTSRLWLRMTAWLHGGIGSSPVTQSGEVATLRPEAGVSALLARLHVHAADYPLDALAPALRATRLGALMLLQRFYDDELVLTVRAAIVVDWHDAPLPT